MQENLEEYISEKVIEKLKEQYNPEKSIEIYQASKEDIFSELEIISKQTGSSLKSSLELYLKNNGNTVKAICSFFNISEEEKKLEEKDNIQKKLDQLRVIANHKDQYYDVIKKKNK